MKYHIKKLDRNLDDKLIHKINTRTKPLGSLGNLEKLALLIGRVQQTLDPVLSKPHHVLFAGDHGIAEMGVSPCPMEITRQMVFNFLTGGAAINVFCKQNGIELKLVDAGVCYDFGKVEGVIDQKVGMGTKNYHNEPAMSEKELELALERSGKVVEEIHAKGSNIIGFGEMGIGNTSSASMIMTCLTDIPLEKCVGAGAGHNSEGIKKKYTILNQALKNHPPVKEPFEVLRRFGGFEVAMMTGGMLKAAELGMVVMVDGFIATASYLVAQSLYPQMKDYAIFCHKSHEGGHGLMLEHLQVEPLLDLNLRLGEGTAVALAYPLIQASVNFLNQMASFESAEVSKPTNMT